jgi:hypothetical protein
MQKFTASRKELRAVKMKGGWKPANRKTELARKIQILIDKTINKYYIEREAKMVTRETLKKEIDYVQDKYLGVLFKIIKTFEIPDESDDGFIEIENEPQNNLVEFFENSPLYNSGIDLKRDKDFGREVKI